MSLGWMAFIALLIAAEKLLPWRAVANRGIAILLLALGLCVAITPASVPGLTLPDSPEAMRAMESMGGMKPGESSADQQMEQGGMQSSGMNSGGMNSGGMNSGGMKSGGMKGR
jgi:hypothetical protein